MQLSDAIRKTLAYFDLFGVPLSAAEVHARLYWPQAGDAAGVHPRGGGDGNDIAAASPRPSLSDVLATLEAMVAEGKLERHEAFYVLTGRGRPFVEAYKQRQAGGMQMLNRNRRWFSILAAWPDVRAVAVCNNLALLNAGPDSDIDLFVVVRPGRLWFTRFVLAGLLAVFGKRPRPGQEQGTICLSFFVADNATDLNNIALVGEDIYLSYWIATLLPAYDPNHLILEMQQQNSTLVRSVQAYPSSVLSVLWQARPNGVMRGVAKVLHTILLPFSGLVKSFQQNRFPKEIIDAEKMGDHRVVISDEMLKFHTNDRREEYRQAWKELSSQT